MIESIRRVHPWVHFFRQTSGALPSRSPWNQRTYIGDVISWFPLASSFVPNYRPTRAEALTQINHQPPRFTALPAARQRRWFWSSHSEFVPVQPIGTGLPHGRSRVYPSRSNRDAQPHFREPAQLF